MPPYLALFIWLFLLLLLLFFDPAKEPKRSVTLWIPLTWMFIMATRLPSQWFYGMHEPSASAVIEGGDSVDRTISLALILLLIGILTARSFNWSGFFSRNRALMMFLGFALLSVLWSDYPFVSFKRWFRDLGNYLSILVILSDPRPLMALRTVFRRLFYILIPLTIVLSKYFPDIGMQWDTWTGAPMFVGPASSKNTLGVVCLISGLFFLWDTVTRWSDRNQRQTRTIILVNMAFFAMTLWVLHLSNSATSRTCLAFGGLVILAAHSRTFKRQPILLEVIVPSVFLLYLFLAFGLDLKGAFAQAVGRDPTFTGRSDIWDAVLSIHTNWLVGTGYDCFWLGSRLDDIWNRPGIGAINEAHNGYLEIYLNLGIIGVVLLIGFLIAVYRTICRRLKPWTSFASFSFGLWAVAVLYNVTEAAFKFHFMWVTFLAGALALPGLADDPVYRAAAPAKAVAPEPFPALPFETTRSTS